MSKYSSLVPSQKTATQGQKILGSDQIKNSEGAYVWGVDNWKLLDRFLILGSEGGSYYASPQQLTAQNAENVVKCIKADGRRVVQRVVDISRANRAPKNEPAILVLALASKLGDEETRRAAYVALPKVCRIPTHLFSFAEYRETVGGWGRGMRNAVARWYTERPISKLAYHLVKYQQRNGWSNRDLLRLSHAKTDNEVRNALFKWAVDGKLNRSGCVLTSTTNEGEDAALQLIYGFETAKRAESTQEIAKLVREFGLTREMVPTQFQSGPEVWEALLEKMPLGAMLRNLGRMSKDNLLKPLSAAAKTVAERLTNQELLRKARIHPFSVLVAYMAYKAGRSRNGTWKPVQPVLDALDAAFYLSFGNVEPTNKKTILCIDTSHSMTWASNEIKGMVGVSSRAASAALALITAATEPQHLFLNFSRKASELSISPKQSLGEVIAHLDRCAAGGTNCAAPIELALERGYEAETIAIYTDNETNTYGARQPAVALRDYREKTGLDTRFIVVGMASNGFSIADPNDAGMLDIVGLDAATPQLISAFSAGAF